MKDYSMGSDSNFILSYEVKENKILTNHSISQGFIKDTISLLLRKKLVKQKEIKYSKENEMNILKTMKQQLLNKGYLNAEKNYLEACYSDFKMNLLRTIIFLIINSFFIGTTLPIILLILLFFYFSLTLKDLVSYFYTKRKIRIIEEDFLKSELFLENEIKLNNVIRYNQNVLDYSSFKIKEIVKSTKLNKPVFTINTIDNISYEELKDFVENLKTVESLEKIDDGFSKTIHL